MKPANSLRRRIALAYLAFAAALCTLFATVAVLAVEGIEVKLVDDRLKAIASWASPRHAGGLPVEMPAGVSFHHGDAIPRSLRGFAPGVHMPTVDGHSLQVYAGRDALGDFVVVDHNTDYFHIEFVVFSMFAASIAGFLLLSMIFGGFVGRRFVQPITRLADAVRAGRDDPEVAGRDDELGLLAQAFVERTRALDHALERERSFTGDVSHEMRSPLTVIMGASEVLMAQAAGRPELAAPAGRIHDAAREAAETVGVLLMLARTPHTGMMPLVDINELARAEVARCQPLVADKPVRVWCEERASLRVHAQPQLCSVAIGNLVRNACQYTTDGEVRVTVLADGLVVEDSGPGLPQQVADMLAGLTASGSAGTGLGLALVRRICAFLGVGFTYEPASGGGSRFTLRCASPDLTRP